MKKIIIFTILGCLATFAGVVVLAWTAISQDAGSAAAGDSFLTIPACAFNEDAEGWDFHRTYTLQVNSSSGGFYAPVNLPNGSVIKKIILICLDNSSSYTTMKLIRDSEKSPGVESIASVLSSGTSSSYRTFAKKLTSNAVGTKRYVNTRKYSYYLWLHLPGSGTNQIFRRALIVYRPPSP